MLSHSKNKVFCALLCCISLTLAYSTSIHNTTFGYAIGRAVKFINQMDEEIAQAQFNQLSLVTRYAGTGYNLIRGNPEGDFNYGGVDPGIKTTNEIFLHTYEEEKEVYYLGKVTYVPDQVSFHMSHSCAASHSVKAYSGRKSYMNELQTSVSVSGGYSGSFASVSFSLSAGMAKAESKTERNKRIVIQKTRICNYGRARYLYENGVARELGFELNNNFINSVTYELPLGYKKSIYMRFIEKWGTHMIITVDVGTREILRSSSSYKQAYKYLKDKKKISAGVGIGVGPVQASASFSIGTLNENINQNTNLGKAWKKFTIGTINVPLPIHLDLKLISKALDSHWWGGKVEWKKYGISRKQKNLVRALKEYPAYVHAKKNTDPLMKVKLSVSWPDGTYALPMARWGCPRGWSSGWRFQDHENSHHATNYRIKDIYAKIKVAIGKDTSFYYCVKTFHGNRRIPWPKGTYCIAKKGRCPGGFISGGVRFDDENDHNKNRRWGVLPDGRYGKDTEVHYCCRSDGNYHRPIVLPRTKPFVLYRFGSFCQRVRGMRNSPISISWIDQIHHNKDKCWGGYPASFCRFMLPYQRLEMCYYHK